MPLPDAVKRNADRARKQVAAMSGSPEKTADIALQPDDDERITIPTIEQETTSADVDTHQTDDSAQTGTQSDQSPDKPAGFIDPQDWKARYAALRAARDKRVSELEERNVANDETIKRLTAQLVSLETTAPEAPKRFELDDDTRTRLGEDQAKVFDDFNESVEQRFQRQDDERAEQAAQRRQRFESDLGSMIPNWQQVNVDPQFLNWLNQNDEVLGQRRQYLLDQFVNDSDAESTAALFRSFAVSSSERGKPSSKAGHSPDVDSTRSDAGLGTDEVMVEVWSQSEIADFYKEKNRLYQSGKLKGERLKAVQAEETRIRTAMDEGRVDMSA